MKADQTAIGRQAEHPSRTLPLSLRILAPFLRLFFRLLYHQMAWTYDLVAAVVSVGLWKTWVRAVIPYLQGPRILELGHGPGHLLAEISSKPGEPGQLAAGLDRSPQMGHIAFRRLRRKGLQPALVNGDGRFLPFASGSLDSLVATFPTEYIAQPGTLAEIYRILRPGGRLILLPAAWITGGGLLYKAAALLFRITGQAPHIDENAANPVSQAGFDVKYNWVNLPTSRLLIITATRHL